MDIEIYKSYLNFNFESKNLLIPFSLPIKFTDIFRRRALKREGSMAEFFLDTILPRGRPIENTQARPYLVVQCSRVCIRGRRDARSRALDSRSPCALLFDNYTPACRCTCRVTQVRSRLRLQRRLITNALPRHGCSFEFLIRLDRRVNLPAEIAPRFSKEERFSPLVIFFFLDVNKHNHEAD